MTAAPTQGPTSGLTPHLTIRDAQAWTAVDFHKAALRAEEQGRMPAYDGKPMM
jgi:PhnB protein